MGESGFSGSSRAVLAILLLLATGAAAFTIVECRQSDGSMAYGDVCPPDTEWVGTRRLGARSLPAKPSLAAIAQAQPVTLYVVPDCDTCDLTRMLLAKRGIPYTERDVENDTALQRELREKSGMARVPTVLIGNQALPGFDRTLLQQRLTEAGYPPTGAQEWAPVQGPQ